MPSKALIEAAGLAHRMRRADRVGLEPVDPGIDLATVMAHVRTAQKAIAHHDAPEWVRAAGADVVADDAEFVGARRVRLKATGTEITARGDSPGGRLAAGHSAGGRARRRRSADHRLGV